jgi:D-methionine transport system substrate-binding protein
MCFLNRNRHLRRGLGLLALVIGCAAGSPPPDKEQAGFGVLTVGAAGAPQTALLSLITSDLKEAGVLLRVVEFTDYAAPNSALMAGEVDANYFQTLAYLESNPHWKAALAPAFPVHLKPLGLYAGAAGSLESLKNAAQVAVPLESSRALLFLQSKGLITLNDRSGLTPSVTDITANPRGLSILAVADPAAAVREMDAAVFTGGNLRECVASEGPQSPYANWVVVRKGQEHDPRIKALKEALCSQKVRAYMYETWKDAIAPAF